MSDMDEDPENNLTFGEVSKRSLYSSIWLIKIYSLIYLIGLGVYFGYTWQNTLYLHGYPQFGSLPVPGDTFVSWRYSGRWWWIAPLVLHVWVPIFALVAAVKARRDLRSQIAKWYAIIISVGTLAILIYLLIQICLCNSGYHPSNICNDYRYCCEHYALNPTLCPNTVDCTPQPLELTWNTEFTFHLLASGGLMLLAGVSAVLISFMQLYATRVGFV